MIKALKQFIVKEGYKGNFYLIENYKNDENFPKYSEFYSSLWFKKDKDKVLLYSSQKIGILKDKETIYKELSSNILLSFLIDVKSGELWKKIK